ncbi:MAG: hypothetical protein AB7O24_08885 [Kofleriaceae bacterium]
MKTSILGMVCLVCACSNSGGTPDPSDPGVDASVNPPAVTRTLFINAEGVTLNAGADDAGANTSSIMTTTTTVSPYLAADPQRATKIAAIVGEVQSILAPYDIEITSTRPATGMYEMIVLTDQKGKDFGLDGVISIIPTSCAPKLSTIGLIFGEPIAQHAVVREIIQRFGSTGNVPSTSAPNDCMCDDSACEWNLSGPCTIGGANTPVSELEQCTQAQTIDVHAEFLSTYGPA